DADFSVDTTIVVKGDHVYFNDLSKGSPQGWFWIFGDGFYSLAQNPSHMFKFAGQFTVSLEIFSNDSSNMEVKQNYIEVLPELIAGFETDTTLAFPGQAIHFFDTSLGNPTSWFWSFGNFSNSTSQNAVTSFDAPGTYTVSLVVSTEYQQDTLVQENLITILEPLNADFYASSNAVKYGEQVSFFDLSAGNPGQWEWWLGNNDTSFVQNPSTAYFEEGFKDVTLIVANQYATDTLHRDDLIYVIAPSYNQVVELKKGWSGIASFVEPVFPDISSVLGDVIDDVHFAVNAQGIFWPDMNINTLGDWNPALGLTIDMKNDAQVTLQGYYSLDHTVDLVPGWNIFPMLRACELPAEMLGVVLGDQFQVVKEIGGWKIYWPSTGINTLGTMHPGKSYLIFMNQESSFSFPACEN
ncbi:MAG: PKD domain-containing protein, partial [Bacteroidota bacterium]